MTNIDEMDRNSRIGEPVEIDLTKEMSNSEFAAVYGASSTQSISARFNLDEEEIKKINFERKYRFH